MRRLISVYVFIFSIFFILHFLSYYCGLDLMRLKLYPILSSFSALTLLVGSFDP